MGSRWLKDDKSFDKKNPHRAKQIKFYVRTTIYFTAITFTLWSLALRGDSGCGDERSALASIPFIITFFAMSAMPYAFMLQRATSRSAAAALFYAAGFLVALAILILSSWGIEAIKPEGSACMIKPAYDAGVCTVVDVKNTDDVEWMKTCKLFGKKDYAFLYKGVAEKYRVDMVTFLNTYQAAEASC